MHEEGRGRGRGLKITLYEGSSFCDGVGYLPDMALFTLDTDTRVGRDLLLDCVPTFVDSLPLDQPKANIFLGGGGSKISNQMDFLVDYL